MKYLAGLHLIDKDLIMKKNKILQSDYLDILFDGRNKSYGSYALRKSQDRRYARSMAVLLGLCISIVTYSVIGKPSADGIEKTRYIDTVVFNPVNIPKEAIKPPVEEVKQLPKKKPKVKAVKNTPPVIKKDNDVKDDEKPPEQDELKNAVVGNENIDGDSTAIDDYVVNEGNSVGTGTIGNNIITAPIAYAEVMPKASYDVNTYLSKHISYPLQAKETGIDGRVIVQFIVNEDGSISGAKVVGKKVYGGGLEDEAVRVVSSMPKWQAGKQNGTPVKVYFTLPISFRLE